ncbi:MAG: DUF4860 domain-containing protein [Coriobacteriales bacterium]
MSNGSLFATPQERRALDRIRPARSRLAEASGPKGTRARRVLPIVLCLLFVLALLAALMAGSAIYRSVLAQKNSVDDSRVALSLLSGYVRANDTAGAVGQSQGPEGPSLVLAESDQTDTYETRIYLYEGAIMQEYAIAGSPYSPQTATRVVDSNTFSFDYRDGLLTLSCDQGTARVALRSVQEDGR